MIKVSVTQAGILMNPCLPLKPDTKPHVVPGAPDTDSIPRIHPYPDKDEYTEFTYIYTAVLLHYLLLSTTFSNFTVH